EQKDLTREMVNECLPRNIEEIHFVSCIIYKEISGTNLSFPEYLIIDGQQRITTFFIFSFVILELLEENSSKMRGEKENSVQALIRHKNPENSEERIFQAYQYFRKEMRDKKVQKHLEDYFRNLKDRVKFVSIKLGEKEDALEIFKSINTSGVVLAQTDLIKAEFFIIYEDRNLGTDELAEE
ncbi:29106_t:CDS:2, partial [Racocetra persica]